jgi:nucleotide-binding universal stress UspA family protein
MSRTILVATDGTSAALGALRFAKELSDRNTVQVHVLGVVQPVPVFDAGFMVALPEMELYESRRDVLKAEVTSQVEAVSGDLETWTVSVQAGVPGPRIVNHAEEVGADSIILGLGRHGPMDRVFGTETTLQVLRLSHLPVLAVPEGFKAIPRSAVMGVDFSLFSQRAAQTATGFLVQPWDVHLVHVLSGMEFLPTLSEEWRGDYEAELMERLEEFANELEVPQDCETHLHVLEGEPSHELLTFSKGKSGALMVAGSHGHSFIGRLLMGSVSTRLIRSAVSPVLVVPPTEMSEELMAERGGEEPSEGWARELNEFTKLNVGRRTTLELDDPELGLQECGRNFPLWGVDYDFRRDRLDIMLGRSGTVEGHLTHSLPAPREIKILRGEDGRTEGLLIEFRSGKATLKIHRD